LVLPQGVKPLISQQPVSVGSMVLTRKNEFMVLTRKNEFAAKPPPLVEERKAREAEPASTKRPLLRPISHTSQSVPSGAYWITSQPYMPRGAAGAR
jgi:hypothetical protein